MECNYKNHADNIWSMGECASCGETCNHEWIVNTHQNTKYCRNNCDGFKEHQIQIMAYIYLNKLTNELRGFGSITALSKATGIKPDNLLCLMTILSKKYRSKHYLYSVL